MKKIEKCKKKSHFFRRNSFFAFIMGKGDKKGVKIDVASLINVFEYMVTMCWCIFNII